MSRRKHSPNQLMLPIPGIDQLLNASRKSKEARDNIRAMLRVRKSRHTAWRGMQVVPPNSFLEAVTDAFRRNTDIPLELPLVAVLTIISGRLLKAGCRIELRGQIIKPSLWTVALAPSGSGKTFATQEVLKIAGVSHRFPEPASAAKFVHDLAEHNNGLWIRDEFGQFLRSLEQQPHLAELRDYLLRLYDGQPISRRTKADSVCIPEPALTVLGATVLESFKNCLSAESLVDGFAQRFNFLIADADPSRTAVQFPLYDLSSCQDRMHKAWVEIANTPLHPIYRTSDGAVGAFKSAFKELLPAEGALPLSFFRRLMFSAFRYAAVFHILLEDQGEELTATDMAWAVRMVDLHLEDARRLLDDYGLGDLERVLRRVEQVKKQIESEGRQCKPRDLIRRISSIRTAEQARSFLALVSEDKKSKS